jgi:glycosidase
LQLYSFADNHDVDRVASLLNDKVNLPLLYTMLFTMPGVPSIYYGSEWGIGGRKQGGDDGPPPPRHRLARRRTGHAAPRTAGPHRPPGRPSPAVCALQGTDYTQLHVTNEQFAYLRGTPDAPAVVVINASETPVDLRFPIPLPDGLPLRNGSDLANQ